MSRPFRIHWFIATLCLVAASALAAQTGAQGSITAYGTSTLKHRPDTLRLQVELAAEGKDLKEALANLKQIQTSIRPQIIALGAAEATVSFADVRMQEQPPDQRRQMERMMRSRMAPGAKPADQPKTPPVAVASTLKAEWPLKAGSVEETLVYVHDLKQKITALASQRSKALTPEEEERMEEEGASFSGFNEDAPRAGEPVLFYVKKIGVEDRAAAIAEAFGKARQQAQQLAAAADVRVGRLIHLTAAITPDYEQYQSNPYAQRMMYSMMQGRFGQSTQSDEAIGIDPGSLTLMITVTAAFEPVIGAPVQP